MQVHVDTLDGWGGPGPMRLLFTLLAFFLKNLLNDLDHRLPKKMATCIIPVPPMPAIGGAGPRRLL